MKKRITLCVMAVMLALALCSCGGPKLTKNKWYVDDRNNTVRTVNTFTEDGQFITDYVLLDEGRAERVNLYDMKYQEEVYYYVDMGKDIPEQYREAAEDECVFFMYENKEDFKNRKNEMAVFYHFEEDCVVIGGEKQMAVTDEMDKEIEKKVREAKREIKEKEKEESEVQSLEEWKKEHAGDSEQ